MSGPFIKDIFREMKRSFLRFASIFVIVALGVAVYIGITQTGPDMLLTAKNYARAYNLFDFRLLCSYGITDDDVAAIRNVEGVAGVMPAQSIDVLVRGKEKSWVTRVHSLPEGEGDDQINRLQLISGVLPTKSNELVSNERFLRSANLHVGDNVKLIEQGNGDPVLKYSDFVIVGTVETPYYMSDENGSSSIGNGEVTGYFYIPRETFSRTVYSEVFVTLNESIRITPFDNDFDDKMSGITKSFEQLGLTRGQIRYDDLRSEAREKLDDGWKDYVQGTLDFQEARDGLRTLAEKSEELEENQGKLDEEKNLFSDKVADAETQLNSAARTLKSTENDLNDLRTQVETLRAQVSMMPDGEQKMALNAQIQVMVDTYFAGYDQYVAARSVYLDNLDAFVTEKEEGARKLEDAQKEIDDGRKEIADKKAEIESKIEGVPEELADAKKELDDGEKEFREIELPEWFVLTVRTNMGLVSYHQTTEKLDAIALLFPTLFFLVALLVSLTALTRMIEEERTTIGTYKSLGYGKLTIAGKYLFYAVIASLLGCAIGTVAGSNIMPTVISSAYGALYIVPPVQPHFWPGYTAFATAIMVGMTAGACIIVCLSELLAQPASLLRPKAPKLGKAIFLQKIPFIWSRLNFTQKVTARNLLRYKKRFFMTVIGIGGCTALLFTGIGMRDCISSIVALQYEEIIRTDALLALHAPVSDEDMNNINNKLDDIDNVTGRLAVRQQSITISAAGESRDVSLVIVDDPAQISPFSNLHTRVGQTPLPIPEDGILLSEKMALVLHLNVGDTVTLSSEDCPAADVAVAGINENYIFHFVHMTNKTYEKCFGHAPEKNAVFLLMKDTSHDAEWQLADQVGDLEGVNAVSFTSASADSFNNVVSNLSYVVLILIVSAMLLAFVVLFNLTSINIEERKRELATIKLLGFYENEVANYIFRENIALTVIGAIVGLPLGVFMHKFVMSTAEVELAMFSRTYSPLVFILSLVLTIVFALIVNGLMRFKIKRINMADSLKSVE